MKLLRVSHLFPIDLVGLSWSFEVSLNLLHHARFMLSISRRRKAAFKATSLVYKHTREFNWYQLLRLCKTCVIFLLHLQKDDGKLRQWLFFLIVWRSTFLSWNGKWQLKSDDDKWKQLGEISNILNCIVQLIARSLHHTLQALKVSTTELRKLATTQEPHVF